MVGHRPAPPQRRDPRRTGVFRRHRPTRCPALRGVDPRPPRGSRAGGSWLRPCSTPPPCWPSCATSPGPTRSPPFFQKIGRCMPAALSYPVWNEVEEGGSPAADRRIEPARWGLLFMASGTQRGTLRHLRDLFHDGSAVGLGDGTLL